MSLSQNRELGEEAGLDARRALGLNEAQPLDDVLRGIERTTEVQIFVRPLGEDGIEGAFWMLRDVPFIMINAERPVARQRFTLAHEFGHFRMAHGNRIDLTLPLGDPDPLEVQANSFAASFLMPVPAVAEALARAGGPTVDFDALVTLAATFGVSAQAMRIRLDTLGYLRPKQRGQFDELIASQQHLARAVKLGVPPVTDSLSVAKREGGRMPSSMERKILGGLEAGLITPAVVERLLRLDAAGVEATRERLTVAAE